MKEISILFTRHETRDGGGGERGKKLSSQGLEFKTAGFYDLKFF